MNHSAGRWRSPFGRCSRARPKASATAASWKKYADNLERWLDHVEDVIAMACACRCPWCPACIESVAETLPEAGEKVDVASRIRDEHGAR